MKHRSPITGSDDPRHATYAGYSAGCRDHCCREAARRYEATRNWHHHAGRPYRVPSIGAQRRLQALVAFGWAFSDLANHLGVRDTGLQKLATRPPELIRVTRANRITQLYDELSMTLPPQRDRWEKRRATIARNHAARKGWLPPLAWDDDRIDDPTYRPNRATRSGLGQELLDHAVVERVLAGQPKPRKLTNAEGTEIYRRLRARGHTTTEIENTYGINSKRYIQPEGDTAA
jgi:hypothetical protein